MSPDTIDNIFVKLVSCLEQLPQDWMDDDESYDHIHEWFHQQFEPYLTADRNYN